MHYGNEAPAETVIEGLVVEGVNKLDFEQSKIMQLNQKKALPPIKRKRSKCRLSSEWSSMNSEKKEVKWNENCKCMRCRLIKNDYEIGVDEQYNHWGHYPCVPDSVINREEQDSSDDEFKNKK